MTTFEPTIKTNRKVPEAIFIVIKIIFRKMLKKSVKKVAMKQLKQQ
jgi:hypothetical protein